MRSIEEREGIQISSTDWCVRFEQVGNNAAIALFSHDRRGTRSILAVRGGADIDILKRRPDVDQRLAANWIQLGANNPSVSVSGGEGIAIYGGAGPLDLTPLSILFAMESEEGVIKVNKTLDGMMADAHQFLSVVRSLQ